MNLQDAYILGRLLAHPILPMSNKKRYLGSIPRVFHTYEKVRLPVVHRAFENTRNCGLIFEGQLPSALSSIDQNTGISTQSDLVVDPNHKYDRRILSIDRLRPYGEEIDRLYSWVDWAFCQ